MFCVYIVLCSNYYFISKYCKIYCKLVSRHIHQHSYVLDLGNYEPKKRVEVRGPGEAGMPYHMAEERANDIASSEGEYGMNIAASDDIAMNRYV